MWALYAVIASFWTCAYHIGNQIAKIPASMFMVYRGLVPIVLLLPFILFISYDLAWQFYLVCAVQGVIFTFMGYRNFDAMHKWGAEVITSIHPFTIGFVFVLWILIHPHAIVQYSEMPVRFVLIVMSIVCIITSVSRFKKSKESSEALMYMFPYVAASAVSDFLNKVAMSYVDSSQLVAANYYYMLISAVVVAIINLGIYLRSGKHFSQLVLPQNLKYTVIIVILLMSIVFKNLAMFEASNPSYVSATIYLYIVWIMLIGMTLRHFGYRGQYRTLEKKKVLMLLGAVITLILCGQ